MRKTGCMSAARFFVLKWKGKVNPMESSNEFLGTERIGKLMQKDAIPCIISLLVGALYNIVDQIFIANASYLGSYGNALAGEEATVGFLHLPQAGGGLEITQVVGGQPGRTQRPPAPAPRPA